MCAFVVFYSVMSVSLEEQRNAHRCLRGDLGKANISSKERLVEWQKQLCRRDQEIIFGHRSLLKEARDCSRGFSKAAPRKLSEHTGADKWVEDGLSREGQNVSNGRQKGKTTGQEWFWRCFEHKDERERIMAAAS